MGDEGFKRRTMTSSVPPQRRTPTKPAGGYLSSRPAALALLLLILASGCRKRQAEDPPPASEPTHPSGESHSEQDPAHVGARLSLPLHINELIVRDLTPEELRLVTRELTHEKLTLVVEEHLAEADGIIARDDPAESQADPPREPPYSLGLALLALLSAEEAAVATEQPGTIHLIVRVELGRPRRGAPAEEYDVEMEVRHLFDPRQDGPLNAFAEELVAEVLGNAIERLIAKIELMAGDDSGVIATLGTDDLPLRAAAAREAGERRLVVATGRLVALLEEEDEGVRLAALGALGRIGDDNTSADVAALTRGTDMQMVIQAIHVLGDIGGPVARRYLKALAETHPVDEVREIASRAGN